MRIDHVERYRLPKHVLEREEEEEKERLLQPGHAYLGKQVANQYNIEQGQDLFAKPSSSSQPPKQQPQEGRQNNKDDNDDDDDERDQHKATT